MNLKEIQNEIEKIVKNQQLLNHNIRYLKSKLEEIQQKTENQYFLEQIIADDKDNSIAAKQIQKEAEKEKVSQKESIIDTQISKQTEGAKITKPTTSKSFDWELFVGQSLISKLGILITIIGVFIGVKYSIDSGLISPSVRVALGYLVGVVLFLVANKLKKDQEPFSAVLLSGSMSIMYFITFVAYSFYNLLPTLFAFLLMALFTVYTVFSAIKYNRESIALIGMVGAYAIPFLLGNDQGNYLAFFVYVLIINMGILAVAVQKNWKRLLISLISATWLIFIFWLLLKYDKSEHANLAFIFGLLFFSVNYLAIILNKIIYNKSFTGVELILSMSNAFIYYVIGYFIVNGLGENGYYLGVFTLFNAALHFLASRAIYIKDLADEKLQLFTLGMVLVFVTLFIPIQLEGNYVTLLWALMALVVGWIGSNKKVPFYLKTAVAVSSLAFLSQLHDWVIQYAEINSTNDLNNVLTPIFNVHFLSNLLFTSTFCIAYYFLKKINLQHQKSLSIKIASYFIPLVCIISAFLLFFNEIMTAFSIHRLGFDRISINAILQKTSFNTGLKHFWTVTSFIYSFIFCMAISYLNNSRINNRNFAKLNLSLFVMFVFSFLLIGLYSLSILRDEYYLFAFDLFSNFSIIGIRYLAILSLLMAFVFIHKDFEKGAIFYEYKTQFEWLIHLASLWLLSSELINLLSFSGYKESYKLGLSILWGLYALFLVVLGMLQNKKHLRVAAIVLFSITLLKLFLYDFSQLNTISKVMVFISLGGLLLLISYLYNKNKSLISND